MELEKNELIKKAYSDVDSLIDKMYEHTWVVKLFQVFLFTDIILYWQTDSGIIGLTYDSIRNFNQLGMLISFIVFFGIMMAYIFPSMLFFIKLIIVYIPGLTNIFNIENYGKASGYVYSHKFYDYALKEKDPILIRLYEKHKVNNENKEAENKKNKKLLFSLSVLSSTECLISICCSFSEQTIFKWIASAMGGNLGTAFLYCLLAINLIILKYSLTDHYSIDQIYYPPLYKSKDN